MINHTIIGLGILLLANQQAMVNESNAAASTVDSFEKLFGVTEGKRRNHTKGFCFMGTLSPANQAMQNYSDSALFFGESQVIGRLSHKGGNNQASDSKPAEYGMGLAIKTAFGETHLMSMNTLDFFPVSTPEAFAELMRAKTQGKAAVKAFKQKNTDLQRFKAYEAQKTKNLTPYEDSTFNSINSFYLVNENNEKTAIRWAFVPSKSQPIVLEPKQNFFFNNMQKNLTSHDITWNMVITIANANDAVNNAAIPWEGDHQQFVAAKLKVLSISTEEDGQCDTINYDPLVLSPGFEASADPLLQARRTSYAISFGKRLSEKKK